MNVVSTSILALMLVDMLHFAAPNAVLVQPETQYSVSGTGSLTVVVDSFGSVGSVPKGASRVPFLSLSMSASCSSDIRVSSVELKHIGLGSPSDISALYAVSGFTRTTRATTFDAKSGIATLRFRALTIPKCGAVNFDILADMSRTSQVASEHGITLTGIGGIASSAKQTTLNLSDATRKYVQLTPTDQGELVVRMLPVNPRVSYGRIETVARLQFTADTKNAHLLKRITLTNNLGARDMDLQWLSLESLSGTVLTPLVPRMRGYAVSLEFKNGFVIHAGETFVMNLKAEIRSSVKKKIQFEIQEPTDVVSSAYRER